jgi:hypothetical protein
MGILRWIVSSLLPTQHARWLPDRRGPSDRPPPTVGGSLGNRGTRSTPARRHTREHALSDGSRDAATVIGGIAVGYAIIALLVLLMYIA